MNIKETIDSNFRGNIYILQDGKVLCESVTGFADLANEVPNTIDTRFASASAGKVFVAVGILQLIDQGRIKLDDTLGELLDMDLHNIDSKVTVEQLLNHTSGVPDYFDESVMEEYEELWADYPNYKIRHNNDLFPLFLHKPMMYEKGSRFQYNNSGYVLLATIIEKVTGLSFDEYLKENIFDVCGMQSTGYYELDRLPGKCANHYIYCAETRPYLQGARLTASCCQDMGFDTTVISDNMIAYTMAEKGIDVFTSASDTITCDGYVANKVGTYQIAIVSKHFGVPFYVTGNPDAAKKTGSDIVIEQRDPEEVLSFRGVKHTLDGVKALYPSFDITPPELITGIITDKGIYQPATLNTYFDTPVKPYY